MPNPSGTYKTIAAVVPDREVAAMLASACGAVTTLTGATTLTASDSGGVYGINQSAAYTITLPTPSSSNALSFTFALTTAGSEDVNIRTPSGVTFIGTIVNDVTSVVVATGNQLTFADGLSAVGDSMTITSLSSTLYLARCVTSAAGGIAADTV